MKPHKVLAFVGWLFLDFASCCFSQENGCKQIEASARMVRSGAMTTLLAAKQEAGDDYRERLVFAFRAFQLNDKSRSAAESLLALIPKNDDQQLIVMTLGDSLCDSESLDDMRSLSRVNEQLASELRKAVEKAPQFMPAYVEYSLVAVGDPHSAYAIEMKKICQRNHPDFLRAVARLSPDQKRQLTRHVMNPEGCQVLALPEAE